MESAATWTPPWKAGSVWSGSANTVSRWGSSRGSLSCTAGKAGEHLRKAISINTSSQHQFSKHNFLDLKLMLKVMHDPQVYNLPDTLGIFQVINLTLKISLLMMSKGIFTLFRLYRGSRSFPFLLYKAPTRYCHYFRGSMGFFFPRGSPQKKGGGVEEVGGEEKASKCFWYKWIKLLPWQLGHLSTKHGSVRWATFWGRIQGQGSNHESFIVAPPSSSPFPLARGWGNRWTAASCCWPHC